MCSFLSATSGVRDYNLKLVTGVEYQIGVSMHIGLAGMMHASVVPKLIFLPVFFYCSWLANVSHRWTKIQESPSFVYSSAGELR